MKMHRRGLVFLGGGRITSALVAGLRLGGYPGNILVYDHNAANLRTLQKQSRIAIAHDLKSAVGRAEILIVAVRPASVGGLLQEIGNAGKLPGLCVSLAAGIPLAILRRHLKGVRWMRAMPSPVCRIGLGLTAVAFDRSLRQRERIRVRELFGLVGQVVEVTERKFDAFTATYSSSHGYHALASLAAAAARAGLDRRTALTAAAHALADGIEYWRRSGLGLDELLHEAATPGGIAAATMTAMDGAGFRRAVEKGIDVGIAQARRNARLPRRSG